MTRVRGLDAARGLALVGMVVAHLDTRIDFDPGVAASWRHVGDGRAAVLFVVVAGFSLALTTGGTRPHVGERLADDRLAIFVRAAVLAALGAFLSALGTPVAVILASYAVYFVAALPFLRAPVPVLIGVGSVLGIAGPVIIAWLVERVPELTTSPIGELFVGMPYPAIQWTGFLLVGLGLGRLRIGRSTLLALGFVGLGVGILLHQLMLDLLQRTLADPAARESLVLTTLTSDHRSQNPVEAASVLAICVAVLALLIALTPQARGLTYPLESVGRMALTLYVGHIVAYWAAIQVDPALESGSGALALWTLGVAFVAASLWFLRFSRGPLEWALHRIVRATLGPRDGLSAAGP
ncbi:DUF1624 domain-containing protein [Aeromicrobium sp. Marseille-Q0843]|uniref:DUF1624 domain-containing protein n=1 Tax=Aeromicrobium phoceense TaxID=2754045 RepID=A0A838XLV0_9ACTN|nr:heparan-alpha-glucosaminide N-acetyltransferase domain-containing protein [Aeromicrobium phoceense]MBA4609758.1 DUF1624 domain-containing protein [Aeromicrobium phoceense]